MASPNNCARLSVGLFLSSLLHLFPANAKCTYARRSSFAAFRSSPFLLAESPLPSASLLASSSSSSSSMSSRRAASLMVGSSALTAPPLPTNVLIAASIFARSGATTWVGYSRPLASSKANQSAAVFPPTLGFSIFAITGICTPATTRPAIITAMAAPPVRTVMPTTTPAPAAETATFFPRSRGLNSLEK